MYTNCLYVCMYIYIYIIYIHVYIFVCVPINATPGYYGFLILFNILYDFQDVLAHRCEI